MNVYKTNKTKYCIEYWNGDKWWSSSIHIHIWKYWVLIFI